MLHRPALIKPGVALTAAPTNPATVFPISGPDLARVLTTPIFASTADLMTGEVSKAFLVSMAVVIIGTIVSCLVSTICLNNVAVPVKKVIIIEVHKIKHLSHSSNMK